MPFRSPAFPLKSPTGIAGDAAAAGRRLTEFYGALNDHLGPLDWWPGETRFEVIVGAILTQNTSWSNVERAIANLRREGLLNPRTLGSIAMGRLERLVHPSGYFRQKARKLKAFVRFLDREFGGSLSRMFREPTDRLREKLLAVHGIGPETADSILLYAGKHPVFVIDAYTRRILARHELLGAGAGYQDAQDLFHRHLPRETPLFNQYHALLVETGKRWCRPRQAQCHACPLGPFLEREP
ncbi:MAG TPA: endonuclease III domain-containing protein [Candidatus Dormibacteraeota bacterium]|nr:endonuclease III domain-containing protein [Candidatus Dormibacteraeota bacterium]